VVRLRRPSSREAALLFAASWPLAVNWIAYTAYYRLDSVILFHARGATELGYYAAAYKFIEVAQIAPTILAGPLLPLVATSLAMEAARRRTILSLTTRTAIVVGTGTAVLLIALAPQLIGVIYGAGFAPAIRPLVLLSVAFVGVPLGFLGSTILSGLGLVRPLALLTVIVAALSLAAQAWAIPRWGATGAAAVVAVTQHAIGVSTCVLAARAMKSSLPLRQLGTAVAITAAIIAAAAFVELPWIAEAALVAIAFCLSVLLFRVITIQDFTRVLARRAL
jgi:O-antigen/teichoic acid export membrane protein